jgi:predicted PurR-regulated permease PerM
MVFMPTQNSSRKTVPESRTPFWWLRWVPAIVVIFLILKFLHLFFSLALVPILASFALAYMLNPLVTELVRRGLTRSLATICTLVLVTLAIVALLKFVIPELMEQGVVASQNVLRTFTPEKAAQHRAMFRRYSPVLDRLMGNRLEQALRNPVEALGSPAVWIAGGLTGFLATAVASLDLILVPFFVYYILLEFGGWRTQLEDLIPPRFRDTFRRLFDEVGKILEAYVRGQFLISLIMVGLYGVAFALLEVPAWAGIAIVAGLLNIVPYVGTGLGLFLALLFTITDSGLSWRIAGVVGVFTFVQMIEGYFLTPRIIGARLSLHPMAVFLALLIGGKLFGLLGVILAVPTIAVAKVFFLFFRELYQGSHFYHAGNIPSADAPSEILEERLADAADTVLSEQQDLSFNDSASNKPSALNLKLTEKI